MTLNKVVVVFLIVATSIQSYGSRTFLGVNSGIVYLDNKTVNDVNKNGMTFGIKLLESFRVKSIFIEPMLGYEYESLFGDKTGIQTSSAFGGLALRFMANQNWSVGLISDYHMGSDQSRSEFNSDFKSMVDLGPQLVYHTQWGENYVRLETSLAKNVAGIGDNNLYSLKLGFQISFDKVKTETPPSANVVYNETIPILIAPSVTKKNSFVATDLEDIKISTKSNLVGYIVDSHELSPASRVKLNKLASFILVNKIKVKEIRISGHTDRNGTREHNLALSSRRADGVKDVFIKAGIDDSIIKTYGYGYSRPLDDRDLAESYEKNRRTEIELKGISQADKELLLKEINKIVEN